MLVPKAVEKAKAHGVYRIAGWVMGGPAEPGEVRYEKHRAI
jgi:hypothetical protein